MHEPQRILEEWSGTTSEYRSDCTLWDLFAEWVGQTPNSIALIHDGSRISYGQLDELADKVAADLESHGVESGSRVGVFMERTPAMVAAILGILKVGAAYLPLDPKYPKDRIDFILDDAQASAVITEPGLRPQVAQCGALVICPGDTASSPRKPLDSERTNRRADDLAYVIYTSGSTGRPKGVAIEHRSAVALLAWARSVYDHEDLSGVLASTSICFDLSVFELFLPLSTGGTIVLVENVLSLRSLAEASEVRLVNTVPSLMSEVLIEGSLPASVKTVNLAGEPLSAALVDELYDMGVERVFDLYGPSETTTYSTYALRERNGPETIGRPIANERVYVLDETMELVPAGESGELYIGGAGVARGYLNNPDLTAERFVADPFSGEPGARMYRTGDRVMWRANGTLVYLGRFDYQVKIRGFRIELGEVETALRSIDGISQAAVTVVTRGSAKLLAAFYVSRDGSVIANDKIRTPLLDVLPDYMIPAYFVHLSEFPLTPSGKLDRRSLPDPRQTTRPELTTPFVAASDDLERFIAERWQAILGLDRVGVNDPFFELGGDSLSAARFIREMQDELGEFLYVVAIFSAPTVARMATFLRTEYGPAILKRFGPSSVAPAVLQQQSNGVEVVDDEMIRQFDERIYRLPPADETVDAEPINDRAMFILAPPRSGTTLLRVMLAGHPGVFAASELQLLGFQTLAQRKTAYSGRHSLWLEGAVRAVKEIRDCSTEEAWELIGVFEQQGLSTRAFYRKLQEWLEGRVLLDKSPSYALDPASLAKAETDFESPFYIHLVRHPEAVIRSFEEYHLDQVLFLREHQFSSRQLAELVWSVSHRNVVRFLKGVAPERQIVVKFEQLVARPEETMKAVCRAAGLSYHEAVSRPYDDLGKRMTDGLHEDSIPMGDTKLLARDAIDPSAADTWKEKAGAHKLGEPTRKLAALFGYDLVNESVETKPIAESGAGARRAAYLAQMRDRRDRSVR